MYDELIRHGTCMDVFSPGRYEVIVEMGEGIQLTQQVRLPNLRFSIPYDPTQMQTIQNEIAFSPVVLRYLSHDNAAIPIVELYVDDGESVFNMRDWLLIHGLVQERGGLT